MTRNTGISKTSALRGRGTTRIGRSLGLGTTSPGFSAPYSLGSGANDTARVARIDEVRMHHVLPLGTTGQTTEFKIRFNSDNDKILDTRPYRDATLVQWQDFRWRPKHAYLPASYTAEASRSVGGNFTAYAGLTTTTLGKEEALKISDDSGDSLYNGTNNFAAGSTTGGARRLIVNNIGDNGADSTMSVEILAIAITGQVQSGGVNDRVRVQFSNDGASVVHDVFVVSTNNNIASFAPNVIVNECRIAGPAGYNLSIIGDTADVDQYCVNVFYRYVSQSYAESTYYNLTGAEVQTNTGGGGKKRWWMCESNEGLFATTALAYRPVFDLAEMNALGTSAGGFIEGFVGHGRIAAINTGSMGITVGSEPLGGGASTNPPFAYPALTLATATKFWTADGLSIPWNSSAPPFHYAAGSFDATNRRAMTSWGSISPMDLSRQLSPGDFSTRTFKIL